MLRLMRMCGWNSMKVWISYRSFLLKWNFISGDEISCKHHPKRSAYTCPSKYRGVLKCCRNETWTELASMPVWNLKPMWVHFVSHVNVLIGSGVYLRIAEQQRTGADTDWNKHTEKMKPERRGSAASAQTNSSKLAKGGRILKILFLQHSKYECSWLAHLVNLIGYLNNVFMRLYMFLRVKIQLYGFLSYTPQFVWNKDA